MRSPPALPATPHRLTERSLVGFMTLLYAVQAASSNPGLAYLPVAAYLTDALGFSATQLASFQAAVLLPWFTKPLWALLADGVALVNYRIKSYLILCYGLVVAGFGGLGLVPQPTAVELLIGISIVSTAVAVSDVLADRLMVVEGQRRQRANLFQAAQWVGWGSTAVAMFLAGGWLADHVALRTIFWLSTLLPGVALGLVVWKLPERPDATQRLRASWQQFCRALRQPYLRRVIGLVVVLQISPLPVDYLYQTQELGFGNGVIGQLKAVEAVGTALGAIGFGLWAWRAPQLPLLSLAVIGQAGATLSLAFMHDVNSAYGVYLLRGLLGIVGFLGLFGRVVPACPPLAEGLTYALLMSVSNLAVSLGLVVGGTLYDLGLPFGTVALVGTGYILAVGSWLIFRQP
ncbi:MFS transporter [Phormidium tenue]|nr:MFS transporter [Phormidium tenue]MBD2230495.1 hypothetical protein [Phormidium tenue FACHB-1052]